MHPFWIQNILEVALTLYYAIIECLMCLSLSQDVKTGHHFLEEQNARKPFQIVGTFVHYCAVPNRFSRFYDAPSRWRP